MNKLGGFFELKESGLPCISFEVFDPEKSRFSKNLLWTVRTAVESGADLNLPRLVGARADAADSFAREVKQRFGENGIVVYYPYFIAEKSGTIEVGADHFIIEAVKADLWNLVTKNRRDVTIYRSETKNFINGNKEFLSDDEYNEITRHVQPIRGMYRDYLYSGSSLLLEWSFAYDSDLNGKKSGERRFIFYELRSV